MKHVTIHPIPDHRTDLHGCTPHGRKIQTPLLSGPSVSMNIERALPCAVLPKLSVIEEAANCLSTRVSPFLHPSVCPGPWWRLGGGSRVALPWAVSKISCPGCGRFRWSTGFSRQIQHWGAALSASHRWQDLHINLSASVCPKVCLTKILQIHPSHCQDR